MADTDPNAQNQNPGPAPVTLDKLMENPDLQKQLQSFVDAQVGKAVEAYKQKGFQTAVEKEVEQRLKVKETKTPEQIRFEEYEAKLADMQNKMREKELTEMRLTNKEKARAKLLEAKLPEGLVDFIASEDSEKTEANIAAAVKVLEAYKTEITQSLLKGNNVQTPGRTAKPGETLAEPGPNASKEEWANYWKQVKNRK